MRRGKKVADNPTTMKLKDNALRFTRRVDIQCWHHDHIEKIARILEEYGKRIDEIGKLNSMLNHEKVSIVQHQIQMMNWDMKGLTPKDPRERGAEMLTYQNGRTYMTDMNGIDEVSRRDDLDEPLYPGPNMRAARGSGDY